MLSLLLPELLDQLYTLFPVYTSARTIVEREQDIISGTHGCTVCIIAASIGSMGEFAPDQEDWTQFTDRQRHFLTANGIEEVGRKRAILLTTIGPKAYKLLRTLVSLEKPGDKTYDVAAMQQHHSPKPSAIVQRYQFNCQFRQEGVSVAQYLSKLCALSEFCEFGLS